MPGKHTKSTFKLRSGNSPLFKHLGDSPINKGKLSLKGLKKAFGKTKVGKWMASDKGKKTLEKVGSGLSAAGETLATISVDDDINIQAADPSLVAKAQQGSAPDVTRLIGSSGTTGKLPEPPPITKRSPNRDYRKGYYGIKTK